MTRYYARYAGKEGFEERYHVIDSSVNEAVSPKMAYHQANDEAEARNKGTFAPTATMETWLAQLNFEPIKADDHG